METGKKYLSFVEAMLLSFTLIVVASTFKILFPGIYENPISYVLSKFLIFGTLIFLIVRLRNLETRYLFPIEKYNRSAIYFALLTIAIFLLERVFTDSLDILSTGAEDFIKRRYNLYELQPRHIKQFLSLIVVGPIMEELMFRGLIFKSFLKRYNAAISIFLSAFLFALLHVSFDKYFLIELVFSFLFASFLAWSVLKTGNIKIAIGCHICWNFCNYVLLPLTFMAIGVRVSTVVDVVVTLLVISIIAIVLLYIGQTRIKRYLGSAFKF